MKQQEFKLKLKKYFHDYDWKFIVKIITFLVLLFLILLDQVIKYVVRQRLTQDIEYIFLPGFINFQYVINYGSAFGLNKNKTALLITFALLIAFVLFIWWIFSRTNAHIFAVTFILAGTIGNLIDRFVFNGGVIDFLKWDMFNPKTIFNTADIFVTIGIIIIIINLIVEGIISIIENKKEKKVQNNSDGKEIKKI